MNGNDISISKARLKESPSWPLPSKSDGERLPLLCLDLRNEEWYFSTGCFSATWTSSPVFVFLHPDSLLSCHPEHWSFVPSVCGPLLGNYSLKRKYFNVLPWCLSTHLGTACLPFLEYGRLYPAASYWHHLRVVRVIWDLYRFNILLEKLQLFL